MKYPLRFKDEHGEIDGISGAFIGAVLVIVLLACPIVGFATNWFGWFAAETEKVIKEEYSPQEMLDKYEWFKDASAQLDAKLEDIERYDKQLADLEAQYDGIPRNEWAAHDARQYSQWITEQTGIITSYNNLAGQYNAQMSKFNYRFANKGDLPQGADEPVQREYREYTSE